MLDRTELIPVHDGERRRIGPFDCEFIPVTHSVPHAFATAYLTPAGTILHSGDFKLDLTPVDGRNTDLALHRRDRQAQRAACKLLLSDSTNAERPGLHAVGVDGRRHACGRCSATTPTSGSSSRASRRTCTACSRSPTPRSPPAARSRSSAGRWCNNVALGREMGMLDIPRRAASSTSTRCRATRPARCASSAPARRASR